VTVGEEIAEEGDVVDESGEVEDSIEVVELVIGGGGGGSEELPPTHMLLPQAWSGLHALQSSPMAHWMLVKSQHKVLGI
jgi:hypothetical protein